MPMKNPPHPGEVVRDAIENGLGLTVTAAAEGLGVSRKTLSQILNGRSNITTEMAIRLEKGIGSSAAAWLRMQMAYDLALAQRTAKSIRVKKLAKAS
jgi:addiction module HigA family antidote|tara:strand:- start:211 stop:501 length:291 start_codon:yes stop_codon:yes gene_type:complete